MNIANFSVQYDELMCSISKNRFITFHKEKNDVFRALSG